MSKGTILYIGGFELPDKNAAAHRVLNNGKIFRELGYDVVFVGVDKDSDEKNSIIDTCKDIQGFNTYSIPYPGDLFQWSEYLFDISKVIEVINKYPDIKALVCYNYQSVAFYKLKKLAKKKDIKIISDCTEWYRTKGRNIFVKVSKGLDTFVRMRILQKDTDGLIVISRYLYKYYNDVSNLIEIPPLIDINENKWKTDFIQRKVVRPLNLTYAGSPGFDKDKINLIIDGLYRLNNIYNFTFKVVGINKKEYLLYYPKDTKKLEQLSGKVFFLGRISHKKSLEEIKTSDYSILFRENDRTNEAGFPTKLVESITCGVPVIANKTSNIDDYIISGCNGYIIGNDIKIELEKIIKMDDLNMNLIRRNIDREMFDYNRYIYEFKQFLQKIGL